MLSFQLNEILFMKNMSINLTEAGAEFIVLEPL